MGNRRFSPSSRKQQYFCTLGKLAATYLFLIQAGPFSDALAGVAKATSSSPLISNGLKNCGNTCYMNAQLQCAFHIPYVRDILASSPLQRVSASDDMAEDDKHTVVASAEEKTASMPLPSQQQQQKQQPPISEASLATQELFEGMVQAAKSNSSPYVPRSFCIRLGIPLMVQQDSQEFWKLLLPAIGREELSDLYQGVYEDYITALDGSGRERRRDEIFLDLSLDVTTCSDLVASLKQRFGEPELLSVSEGNGWRPEKGAEKVDANKGSSLVAKGLPSILQFHLLRFKYDWQTETTTKVNNRFTFPADLDLKTVCTEVNYGDEDLVQYELQSVVVHVGEYGVGHYYSYVRTSMEDEESWYRFNDDMVQKVSFQEVMDDVYGGIKANRRPASRKGGVMRKVRQLFLRQGSAPYGWGGKKSNAYVVQYVRRRDIPSLYMSKEE